MERRQERECPTSSDQVGFGVVPALVVILYHIQTCGLLKKQTHQSSGLALGSVGSD